MKKYLIIILLVTLLSIIAYLIIKDKKNKYNVSYNDNNITINYPSTNYYKVNTLIKEYLDTNINNFKNITLDKTKTTYYLIINYKEYYYHNLISYIFFSESFTGGAHLIHLIKSFVYNIDTNSFITINTLIKSNPNILNKLSDYTYHTLSNKKIFQNQVVNNMLKEGTLPTTDNFKNILFTDKGLIIYFERYKIAPYYYGDYNITIPYEDLNLKKVD